ncbi:hypothetical protein [Myceligenerans indicum]|uniref:SMI1/KNR4 family protein n=1 Tax=Myceligenerans indicum TaxID=2593663 RepID=A0ABS1LJH1_9MICO|nr:hypothetical protein [Myceligenerans indicum]MBL0886357.1 hypothetical protein [Myceligenerans indicum]
MLPEVLADRLRTRAHIGDTVRLVVVQNMDGRDPVGARGFYLQPLALAWLARAGAELDLDQYADLVDEPEEVDFGYRPPLDLEWWRDRMVASVRLLDGASAELEERDAASNEFVPAASPGSSPIETRSPALDALYQVIDEVCLPGVHIGYWIHPAEWLSEAEDRRYPTSVVAEGMTREVVTFGSDGGGGLFVLALDCGEILHVYSTETGNETRSVEPVLRQVAPDLDAFLRKLLDVVDELVETGDTEGI